MAPLKFLSVAAAALLCAANAQDETAGATAEPTVIEAPKCLETINAARKLVELPALEKPEKKDQKFGKQSSDAAADKQKDFLKQACAVLNPKAAERTSGTVEKISYTGNFAYAAQADATDKCDDAVETWKKAVTKFESLPPKYTEAEKLYQDNDNLSFVAMFNTNTDATMECGIITCPAEKAAEEEGEDNGPKEEEEEDSSQSRKKSLRSKDGETETKADVYGLVCYTAPKTLSKEKEPFTEEQWKKITSALSSSAATAAPAALAVAAAVAGAAFL